MPRQTNRVSNTFARALGKYTNVHQNQYLFSGYRRYLPNGSSGKNQRRASLLAQRKILSPRRNPPSRKHFRVYYSRRRARKYIGRESCSPRVSSRLVASRRVVSAIPQRGGRKPFRDRSLNRWNVAVAPLYPSVSR